MSERITKRARLAAPMLVIYWIAVFTATHIPKLPFSLSNFGDFDKVLHASAFIGLTLLMAYVAGGWFRLSFATYLTLFLVAVAYGAFDEWAQQFTHRSTSLYDWLADACGAFVGLLIHLIVSRSPSPAHDDSSP